jgi:hypothetical protein
MEPYSSLQTPPQGEATHDLNTTTDAPTTATAPPDPPTQAPPACETIETDVPPWMACPNGGCCDG